MTRDKPFASFLFYVLLFSLVLCLFVCLYYNVEDPSLLSWDRISTAFDAFGHTLNNYSHSIMQIESEVNEDLYNAFSIHRQYITVTNQYIQDTLNFMGYNTEIDGSSDVNQDWQEYSVFEQVSYVLVRAGNLFVSFFTIAVPGLFVSLGYLGLAAFDLFMGFCESIYSAFGLLGDIFIIIESLHP